MSETYEWDEAKRVANLSKHGIDFAHLGSFEWATAMIVLDRRRDYGEARYRSYGRLQDLFCVVIFTLRGETYRIISVRRASRRERTRYEQAAIRQDRR